MEKENQTLVVNFLVYQVQPPVVLLPTKYQHVVEPQQKIQILTQLLQTDPALFLGELMV